MCSGNKLFPTAAWGNAKLLDSEKFTHGYSIFFSLNFVETDEQVIIKYKFTGIRLHTLCFVFSCYRSAWSDVQIDAIEYPVSTHETLAYNDG